MHPDFDLVIGADADGSAAELWLRDAAGTQLAYRRVDFEQIPLADVQGLFNLREFVQRYAADSAEERVAHLGVCLAHQVLGPEIFGPLAESDGRRTLRVRLPAAETTLAAALARVPWEIARKDESSPTLAETNLIVRAVVGGDGEPEARPLTLGEKEALRVLFVFAEAPGSRPLAAREEREALLALFEKEIYPKRRVEADVLAHGVTRERLEAMIADHRGYHVVHWSGHGGQNLLELAGGDLSGEDLVTLLRDAGGFKPRLFFLSACHSGDVGRVRDWDSFQAVAAGRDPEAKDGKRPGYTGTAHALLRAEVPSVVAMRYSVGDDYARDLAVDFYRRIFAAANPAGVAEALNLSRKHLLRNAGYHACDHATPMLYGADDPGLPLREGRSRRMTQRNLRLGVPIGELDIREHPYFVGRTRELAGLGAGFFGYHSSASVQPVALVQGMGGMGKTALVAEALDLWERQFDWVLPFQAKPNPLNLDTTLSEIHRLLWAEGKTYHDHVQNNPADAVWRPAEVEGEFRGERRMERLRRNLLRAMQDEAILLVLDNFETNLKPQPEKGPDDPVWACQDPEWDRLLSLLAKELPGTASRVLITSRRPLAALPAKGHHRLALGPLPPGEAALYLRSHEELRRLILSADENDRRLAERLFAASRFHPLLLDRLGRLVALRPQLEEALAKLESAHGYADLPGLFAAGGAEEKELAYLKDALESSIDLLLEHAGAEARQLLWIIALANDPEPMWLLRWMWGETRPTADLWPLLGHLIAVGLVTAERHGPEDDNHVLTCHELVRERILAWIGGYPDERLPWEESAVRLAYAGRLAVTFEHLLHKDTTLALEAGRRALVYCVQAGAYDRLRSFAGTLLTSTRDPRLLRALLPHLEAAARSAPAGRAHWSCLAYLADALVEDRPDASLPFYEQAASEASAAEHWSDVGWITANWANALGSAGDLEGSRAKHLESAEASRRAGRPKVTVLSRELEAYRIDVLQGRAAEVLPEVEQRIAQVEEWWERSRQRGEKVPEAPDGEYLAHVLISAFDVAGQLHFVQKDWNAALRRIDRALAIERELRRPAADIALAQMNRANVLTALGRYGEAQAELEACLDIFRGDPARSCTVLSSLATLFDYQGDVRQAVELGRRALAIREQLPDPSGRAISHNNLANYLEKTGTPSASAESADHQLAALAYRIVAGLGADLQTSLDNYAIRFRRAKTVGIVFTVPRLPDLLARPVFRPLAQWLDQREVDREELQAKIDELLEMVRQKSES